MGAALASAGRRELALLGALRRDRARLLLRLPRRPPGRGAARASTAASARLEPIEVEESLDAPGLRPRLPRRDPGRHRPLPRCLREAQAVLELSASVGMRLGSGALILWWRLRRCAGWATGTGWRRSSPRRAGSSRAGAGTNVAYRITAGLARPRGGRPGRHRDGPRAHRRGPRGAARTTATPTRSPRCCASWCSAGGGRAARTSSPASWRRRRSRPPTATSSTGSAPAPSLLSATCTPGTPLGDARLAEALALTGAPRPGHAVAPARAAPRGGAAGARDAEAASAGRRRPRAWPPRAAARCCTSASRALADPRRPGAAGRRGGRGDRRRRRDHARLLLADADAERRGAPPSAPAWCWSAARASRSASRRSAACACTAPARGCPTPRSGARRPGRCSGALVCAEPRGAHRDRLLEHLWPELPPERGARALDTTLHELRRTLEPLAPAALGRLAGRSARARSTGSALGERDSWDAGEFLRAGPRRRRARADEVALGRMLRAETLWRGDFLPDFPYEPWAEDTRRELERERGWPCWSAWPRPWPRWAARPPRSSATATSWTPTPSARAGTAP